jgi:hypothetical protein
VLPKKKNNINFNIVKEKLVEVEKGELLIKESCTCAEISH